MVSERFLGNAEYSHWQSDATVSIEGFTLKHDRQSDSIGEGMLHGTKRNDEIKLPDRARIPSCFGGTTFCKVL